MSRAQLIEMAKHNLGHAKAGTIEQTEEIIRVPASNYYDLERWQLEMDRVFKRVPLMLAMTAEIPNTGDYKSMIAVDTPILISRGEDGEVRAFINMCRHRGSQIMPEGTGNTKRFTCPYHAWSYSQSGELIGVYAEQDFGDVDKSCNSLVGLPVAERAGLIWVTINPNASLDIDAFLSGYDELLGHFGFETWHFFESRTLKGPNWKIAYDGYLDLYHLPILHKDTFGNQFPNQAIYYAWGPHQRVSSPDPSLEKYEGVDESEWNTDDLMAGVWTIFPHVSIAGFDGGGRGVMLSQLFPGESPLESVTVQNYLMEKPPENDEIKELAHEQFKFLEYVVKEEDYATGLRQQRALLTGNLSHVMFGRNEGGGQAFHGWLEKILAADDQALPALFQNGKGQ